MKLNRYDILFYAIYNVMKRQGNADPKDDKFEGLIGGALFLPLVPLFIYFDIAVIFNHFCPLSILPGKTILIITGCALVILNLFLFKRENRYLAIDEMFESMEKKQRKKYLYSAWSCVLVILVIFFTSVNIRFTTY
jgi:hypothetical protein